jgi:hypothetical protein
MPAPGLAEHPHLHPASPAGEYRLRQTHKSGAALTPVCATIVRRLGCVASTLITSGLGGPLRDAPCTFCGRSPTGDYALTACASDPDDIASWRREVLPVCSRFHKALEDAGSTGRRFKTTGERWWLGYGVGRFSSSGGPSA